MTDDIFKIKNKKKTKKKASYFVHCPFHFLHHAVLSIGLHNSILHFISNRVCDRCGPNDIPI